MNPTLAAYLARLLALQLTIGNRFPNTAVLAYNIIPLSADYLSQWF